MSTRSQIRVIGRDGTVIDLYHHCDGYFEGVGNHLQVILADTRNELKFLAALMNSADEMSGYELTDTLHGDIEYFYLVDFKNSIFKGWRCQWQPWPKEANINSPNLMPNIEPSRRWLNLI